MELEKLGWNDALAQAFAEFRERGLEPARVANEDKHFYTLISTRGELAAQVSGKVLHRAKSPGQLPKVGDWVAMAVLEAESKAVIHEVLPRRTQLARKVPGRETQAQVLVANADLAFVVQACDGNFNRRRLQRYLVMVLEGGLRPVVVLNKADLATDLDALLASARSVAGDHPLIAASAKTGQGIERLAGHVTPGTTAVFLGSSGVGKSSLINRIYGEEILPTTEVRESDSKGRHTTTWREMILMPSGGLVIDTPGMREFHLWSAEDGVFEAFPEIDQLAARCQFRDCRHRTERNCAVRDAVANGALPREQYELYCKLRLEADEVAEARTRRGWLEKKQRAKAVSRGLKKFNWNEQ